MSVRVQADRKATYAPVTTLYSQQQQSVRQRDNNPRQVPFLSAAKRDLRLQRGQVSVMKPVLNKMLYDLLSDFANTRLRHLLHQEVFSSPDFM